MPRFKVLITDLVDELLINGLVEAGYDVDYRKDITQSEVNNIVADYSGIVITTKIGLSADIIAKASNLKWIARAGSGMDHVDVKAAEQKNIACICSPEGNAGSVGEHCVAMLLAMLRRIPQADASTKSSPSKAITAFHWETDLFRVHELEGMTIGILGYGHTGPAFAKRLQGFNVEVIAYDKYKTSFNDAFAQKVELNILFERADVLSIHLPLTHETRNMIDDDFLHRFTKPIYFINTSRGNIAPVRVLINALNTGKVKFAAIDVLDNELPETQTPFEKAGTLELLRHPNLVVTPHVAGKSSSTRRSHARVLLSKILIHSGL